MAAPAMVKTATPGVYKRGSRYVVVYRDPAGAQRKRFARTLAEARDVKATLRADVTRGEYRALAKVTFADYAVDWIESYHGRTARGVGQSTRDDYRDSLERFAVPFFGRALLAMIEPRDIKRFVAHLADSGGLAPASVRRTVAPVRALFADALDEGLLRSNPTARVRIARRAELDEDGSQADRVKALTEEELARLLTAVRCPSCAKAASDIPCVSCGRWRLLVAFLSQTGLRIGEAIELRWKDVDLGDRWVHVQRAVYRAKVGLPKSGKKRRLRITAAMAAELWRLRKDTKAGDDELVFTAERGGRVDQTNLLARILKPAGRRAGVGDWIHNHTMRHTCATLLFRAGWNAVQVQKFLGHSDPGFTLRTYVHLLPEDLPEPIFFDIGAGDRENAARDDGAGDTAASAGAAIDSDQRATA